MTDEILELAIDRCVDLKRVENDTFHTNVDAYEISYVNDTFLLFIKPVLKRGWFIKGNKLYVYQRMKRNE